MSIHLFTCFWSLCVFSENRFGKLFKALLGTSYIQKCV